MEAAFLFEAFESSGAFMFAGGDGAGGMPIADAGVTLIAERVVGQVVFFEIVVDLFARPVEDGVDFVDVALFFDDAELVTVFGLSFAKSCEPGSGFELA